MKLKFVGVCVLIFIAFLASSCASLGNPLASADINVTEKYDTMIGSGDGVIYLMNYRETYRTDTGRLDTEKHGLALLSVKLDGTMLKRRIELFSGNWQNNAFSISTGVSEIHPVDNGYIIVSRVSGVIENQSLFYAYPIVVKINENLEEQWRWRGDSLQSPASDRVVQKSIIDADEKLVLLTWHKNGQFNGEKYANVRLSMAKLNLDGTILDQYLYEVPFAGTMQFREPPQDESGRYSLYLHNAKERERWDLMTIDEAGELAIEENVKRSEIPLAELDSMPDLISSISEKETLRLEVLPDVLYSEEGNPDSQPYRTVRIWDSGEIPWSLAAEKAIPLPWAGLSQDELKNLRRKDKPTVGANNNPRSAFDFIKLHDSYLALIDTYKSTQSAKDYATSGFYHFGANLELQSDFDLPLTTMGDAARIYLVDSAGKTYQYRANPLEGRPQLFRAQKTHSMTMIDSRHVAVAATAQGLRYSQDNEELSIFGETLDGDFRTMNTIMLIDIGPLVDKEAVKISPEMVSLIIASPSSPKQVVEVETDRGSWN